MLYLHSEASDHSRQLLLIYSSHVRSALYSKLLSIAIWNPNFSYVRDVPGYRLLVFALSAKFPLLPVRVFFPFLLPTFAKTSSSRTRIGSLIDLLSPQS